MSVSAVSGISANSTQPTSNQANFWQTFTELVGALNSNDLSGAQQAYSELIANCRAAARDPRQIQTRLLHRLSIKSARTCTMTTSPAHGRRWLRYSKRVAAIITMVIMPTQPMRP